MTNPNQELRDILDGLATELSFANHTREENIDVALGRIEALIQTKQAIKEDEYMNLEDYIGEDERKEIAVRVFEEKLRDSFGTAEAERVVTNMAYSVAETLINKHLNEEFREAIESKLPEIIASLSSFVVFNRGDDYGAFRKEPTLAYKAIDNWFKKNNQILEDRVLEVVNGIDETTLKEQISEAIYRAVVEPTL